ncbi:Golgi membrane protein 1 isoform X2 [Poecilia reticulata]|uniref:Golgi membrane protein 1 isoform X2 n=1 Tax=Poecilia reticulata TaxID=8081 RepID=UPI0007EA75C1|nr:PREDICTED: Golgi membrane protein 1 isoform X2 [Poecilia reticulata]
MGGLGNGRRGGRAPPLMVAALIACILVLGFNYWVSSSRNLELQTKLYELEGQVRRGAAERGVAEMKKNEFQEQIQKQVEEISHIESLRRKQLDTYSQEKAKLQQNISSSTKTIEELKGQLNQMNNDLGKLQKELQRCQANPSILSNKLTVDIAHCQSQVLSQKKLCDEKVAAVKLEVQKNVQKVVPPAGSPTQQKNAETGEQKEEPTGKAAPTEAEAAAAVSQEPNIPQGKGSKASELLINIDTDKESSEQPLIDDLSKAESQTVGLAASENQDKLQQKEGEGKTSEATTRKGLTNHLMDDKDIEVMDVHGEDARTEADQGVQDILIGQEKAEETANGQRPEEPDEYDGDEQVVDGVDLEKEQRNKNTEEEMADYNGDDENEGEFEADKQAALAQN